MDIRRTRGHVDPQACLFSYFSVEERIPADHPLRRIKPQADAALAAMARRFDAMYAECGRPSVAPERLLKASLLIALYTVRSDRLFCEMLDYNMLFRWFLDMKLKEKSFDHSTFSKNRERLIAHEIAKEFFAYRALDRYEEAAVRRIGTAISSAHSIKEGMRQFVQRIVEDILAGPGRRGCFIGNCAAELNRGDRAGAARVRRSLQRLEGTFRDTLSKAQSSGEISHTVDIEALARFITAGIQGLRLVGKANPDRAVLEDIAQVMLRCLEER